MVIYLFLLYEPQRSHVGGKHQLLFASTTSRASKSPKIMSLQGEKKEEKYLFYLDHEDSSELALGLLEFLESILKIKRSKHLTGRAGYPRRPT